MIKIYNSSTKLKKEINNTYIKFYTCGITPYDTTHLGHAFTYIVCDVLIRYLEFLGCKVTYVQNVTDIDDDILRKATEVGENWYSLGNRWTRHFIQDMKSLNMRAPDYLPRATDFIPQIIEVIQMLIKNGLAYENNENVYFEINKWERFGELCQFDPEEMLSVANERGNNPLDQNKKHPLDFVLWQCKSPGEPSWKSPWGQGRPGWHIECSTMATSLLGENIDIHSGGSDLLFPHHECEIAQIEPILENKPFVNIWMHISMVFHQGQKMSKSIGNLVMVRDLLTTWSANTVRTYLLLHHRA